MAIIVEEEKKSSGILTVLGWIVIIGIVIVTVYYVFFVIPPSAIILPSGNLQTINSVSPSNLDPQSVIGSSEFQALKQYVASPVATGPAGVGRMNPFLAP
jgi:hypothetical protein